MPDLRSRRRMASAAGISLLLHLAVLGALSLIGPHFAAGPAAGNDSHATDTRITIHAPQDDHDARASERPTLAHSPSADAPNPDPQTEHKSHDTTVTEPASARPSPDPTPNPDSRAAVTERTTSLPEGNREPHAEPEARRTTRIASRGAEPARVSADTTEMGDTESETDETAHADTSRPQESEPSAGHSTPPAAGAAGPSAELSTPPPPEHATPRRSRPTGERPVRPGTEDSGVSRSDLIRALYSELEEAFHYPPIARRRSLEGSVELLVEVAVDGELRSVTVEQSSGSRILDEAAAETVTRLFPRSRAQRSTHEVRLRVHYELN